MLSLLDQDVDFLCVIQEQQKTPAGRFGAEHPFTYMEIHLYYLGQLYLYAMVGIVAIARMDARGRFSACVQQGLVCGPARGFPHPSAPLLCNLRDVDQFLLNQLGDTVDRGHRKPALFHLEIPKPVGAF